MLLMKALLVSVYIAVLNFHGRRGFTVGGRFPRESESDNNVNKTVESTTANVETGTSASPDTVKMIPLVVTPENPTSETLNVTDLEADKFIESLKNQSNGIGPLNKNETHISSNESLPTNTTTVSEAQNATNTEMTPSNPILSADQSHSTSTVGDTSQPTQVHMFQNEGSPSPLSNNIAGDNTTNLLNETNIEKGLNESCPSDCSADSCKPECSFHCCLKEKSSASNNSMAGYYNQDASGNTSAGLAFDSSKLEKMLLDTISEFTQKLPHTQQTQKLSEIMTDPSNHYDYAPSYDASNNNNNNKYNFMEQMPNQYLASRSNMYLTEGYSNNNNNNNNYAKPYNYADGNQNFAAKSQINPTYPYKRNQISDPNYPIASTHHHTGYQRKNIARAFLYNPDTNSYQSRRFYRRARIYSPYKPSYQA